MPTCDRCKQRVAQIINRSTEARMLVDLEPSTVLGIIKVDWANRTGEVLSVPARAAEITAGEELYVNHMSTCAGSDRDPQRGYLADVERMVGE